ncbi:MAG TPA: hypothetical protein PKG57_00810, partial [Flavobacteriales bacterium]|nr:hypothetical protein [Flavobacteriales bacterium]
WCDPMLQALMDEHFDQDRVTRPSSSISEQGRSDHGPAASLGLRKTLIHRAESAFGGSCVSEGTQGWAA